MNKSGRQIAQQHIEYVFEKMGIQDGDVRLDMLRAVLQTERMVGDDMPPADRLYKAMKEAGMTPHITKKSEAAMLYEALTPVCGLQIIDFIQANMGQRKRIVSPALISEIMSRIPEDMKTVRIVSAECYDEALATALKERPHTRFILTTDKDTYTDLMKAAYTGIDNVEVKATDRTLSAVAPEKFDGIVSLPLVGEKPGSEQQCQEEVQVVSDMLACLTDKGRLISLLALDLKSSRASVKRLRQLIKERYGLRELALLPGDVFDGVALGRVYLCTVTATSTQKTILRRYENAGKRPNKRRELICKEEVECDTRELMAQDEWNVELELAKNDPLVLRYMESATPKKRLGDMASIIRGKSVRGDRIVRDGNIGVIQLNNLADGEVLCGDMDRFREEERKVSPYILNDGDVLVSVRGTVVKTAVFHDPGFPCISSTNLIAIRPQAGLDSDYLHIFLSSPVGEKILSGKGRSKLVLNLNQRDLEDLLIPILSEERQQEIALQYNTAKKTCQRIKAQAESEWQKALETAHKSWF